MVRVPPLVSVFVVVVGPVKKKKRKKKEREPDCLAGWEWERWFEDELSAAEDRCRLRLKSGRVRFIEGEEGWACTAVGGAMHFDELQVG